MAHKYVNPDRASTSVTDGMLDGARGRVAAAAGAVHVSPGLEAAIRSAEASMNIQDRVPSPACRQPGSA